MLRSATPPAQMRAGMVYQNAPHHLSGDPEKMVPIFPSNVPLADEPQVSLMHQRRGLERMIPSLAAHVGGRQTVKLVIDAGHQLRSPARTVIAHLGEQFTDFRHVTASFPTRPARFCAQYAFLARFLA